MGFLRHSRRPLSAFASTPPPSPASSTAQGIVFVINRADWQPYTQKANGVLDIHCVDHIEWTGSEGRAFNVAPKPPWGI